MTARKSGKPCACGGRTRKLAINEDGGEVQFACISVLTPWHVFDSLGELRHSRWNPRFQSLSSTRARARGALDGWSVPIDDLVP